MRRQLTEKQPTKAVLQICVWEPLSESFKNVCDGVEFSK